MSLPARQQRVLDRIEQTLVADEPRLGSLFAIFTRLTCHEAIPGNEHVGSKLRRLAVIVVVTVIALTGLAVSLWLIPGRHACSMTHGVAGHDLSGSWPAGCGPDRHGAPPGDKPADPGAPPALVGYHGLFGKRGDLAI